MTTTRKIGGRKITVPSSGLTAGSLTMQMADVSEADPLLWSDADRKAVAVVMRRPLKDGGQGMTDWSVEELISRIVRDCEDMRETMAIAESDPRRSLPTGGGSYAWYVGTYLATAEKRLNSLVMSVCAKAVA